MLFEGIRLRGNNIVFDFQNDLETDVIPLRFQKFNKSLSTRNGIKVYFGYRYQEGVNKDELVQVRDAIKTLDYSRLDKGSLQLMIQKAVNNFLQVSDQDFDLIITPKSSSGLPNLIAQTFKQKLGQNVLLANDSIVKSDIGDIKIDPVKAKKLSPEQRQNIEKVIHSASKSGSFKMKQIPIPMRRIIIDFMKFDSELDRKIFNALNNGRVLLIDDIYTGGSTFTEMTRIIQVSNPENITGFILLLSQ
jgi:hypothetical protein